MKRIIRGSAQLSQSLGGRRAPISTSFSTVKRPFFGPATRFRSRPGVLNSNRSGLPRRRAPRNFWLPRGGSVLLGPWPAAGESLEVAPTHRAPQSRVLGKEAEGPKRGDKESALAAPKASRGRAE